MIKQLTFALFLVLCVFLASASDDAQAPEDLTPAPPAAETPEAVIANVFTLVSYIRPWASTIVNVLKRAWEFAKWIGAAFWADCTSAWYNVLGCIATGGAGMIAVKLFWSKKSSTHMPKKSPNTTNKTRAKPNTGNANKLQPVYGTKNMEDEMPRPQSDRIVKEKRAKMQAKSDEQQTKKAILEAEAKRAKMQAKSDEQQTKEANLEAEHEAKRAKMQAKSDEQQTNEAILEAEHEAKRADWFTDLQKTLPFQLSVIQTLGLIGVVIAILNFHVWGVLCAVVATTVDSVFFKMTGYDMFEVLVKFGQCADELGYTIRSFINSTSVGLQTLQEIPESPVLLSVLCLLLGVILAYYLDLRLNAKRNENDSRFICDSLRKFRSKEYTDAEEHDADLENVSESDASPNTFLTDTEPAVRDSYSWTANFESTVREYELFVEGF